jgi:hypothetical protein
MQKPANITSNARDRLAGIASSNSRHACDMATGIDSASQCARCSDGSSICHVRSAAGYAKRTRRCVSDNVGGMVQVSLQGSASPCLIRGNLRALRGAVRSSTRF